MQLEISNFTPDAATWRTWSNNVVWRPTDDLTQWTGWNVSSLILAHLLHYVKTWHHPQNKKYIMYSITQEEDW